MATDPVIASAARQSMPETTPIPGGGRWSWDASAGQWLALPLNPEPSPGTEPDPAAVIASAAKQSIPESTPE